MAPYQQSTYTTLISIFNNEASCSFVSYKWIKQYGSFVSGLFHSLQYLRNAFTLLQILTVAEWREGKVRQWELYLPIILCLHSFLLLLSIVILIEKTTIYVSILPLMDI